jgi:hypothetical protein
MADKGGAVVDLARTLKGGAGQRMFAAFNNRLA